MSPSRARYVTACQQLLALGVVVIALVPATRVISLDVVGVRPPGEGVATPTISVPAEAGMSGYARSQQGTAARSEQAQRQERQLGRGVLSARAERRTDERRTHERHAHRPGRSAPAG